MKLLVKGIYFLEKMYLKFGIYHLLEFLRFQEYAWCMVTLCVKYLCLNKQE